MKNYKYTKEVLEPTVKISFSWAGVCRNLGISDRSGVQGHIKKVAVAHEIDFSHFTGQGWSKGKTFTKKNLTYYLVKNSKISSHDLRKRLISEGIKQHKCEECGKTQWNKKPIPLELDHINGDHKDNTLDNLRILCPNCHAQTETYCRARQSRIKNPKRVCECGSVKDKNANKCLHCFREGFKLVTQKKICNCGSKKSRSSVTCKKCDSKRREKVTKIKWPALEVLKEEVAMSGYSKVGRDLGVTDNAVRKRIKKLMSV